MAKQVKPVVKPLLYGPWNSKDATRKGFKLMLSILFISFIYILLGLLLSFDSTILRIMSSTIIIFFAAYYMFTSGTAAGETDAHYSEIMYEHKKEGKSVTEQDLARCYHGAKGFYEIGIALIPYLIITLVFAVMTEPIVYSLGVLPSWLEYPIKQTNTGDALAYYTAGTTAMFFPILRVIVRAMTMPFINVALLLGDNCVLWTERLTPLFISVAPLAYSFGYLQGPQIRTRVNTGIKIGVHKKKRKARKDKKTRTQQPKSPKSPERLI